MTHPISQSQGGGAFSCQLEPQLTFAAIPLIKFCGRVCQRYLWMEYANMAEAFLRSAVDWSSFILAFIYDQASCNSRSEVGLAMRHPQI